MLSGSLNSNQQPSELDFNLEPLGQFDCDVEEVLRNELNLGGEMDFTFGGSNTIHQSALENGGGMFFLTDFTVH